MNEKEFEDEFMERKYHYSEVLRWDKSDEEIKIEILLEIDREQNKRIEVLEKRAEKIEKEIKQLKDHIIWSTF